MGICKLNNIYRRIELFFQNKNHIRLLSLFTGSGDFNIDLRNYCLVKDRLNEYGLKYINGEKGEFVEHQFKNEKYFELWY